MTAPLSQRQTARVNLALKVERLGDEMSPCSFCVRNKRRCVAASSQSSRCSECCRAGRMKCDYTEKLPSVNDWASIDRQRQKLRAEEEEAMSKILRLRQQQRFLDEKEKEMLKRGLATLDELDAAEEAERQLAESLEASAAALADAGSFLDDPCLDPAAFAGLPEAFWANLGVVGGNPEGAAANLPGAS